MNRTVLEGPYLRDLLEQPAALRRAWETMAADESLQTIARRSYHRIVLSGMGSSLYALYTLHLHLIHAGRPSQWTEAAELIHYQRETLSPDTLVIIASQSGESAELLSLMEMVRGRSPLIVLTNTPDSRLAQGADAILHMSAGPEATVACKTYLCTLLLLEWLAAVLTGSDLHALRERLRPAPDLAAEYLDRWQDHVENLERDLAPIRRVFVTGRGPSVANAEAGGLILKESMRFHSEGMSSAAFRHGPFEVVDPNVLVVVMEGDAHGAPMNRRLVDDVRAIGGRAQLVGPSGEGPWHIPASDPALRPVLEMLPVQMMTLALGAIAGRAPGNFERTTKVTTIE